MRGFAVGIILLMCSMMNTNIAFSNVCKTDTPILLLHGINADKASMRGLQQRLEKVCAPTKVFNIELGNGRLNSFTNLWNQAEQLRHAIEALPELSNGFDLIAHSQGGLVARAYIETYERDDQSFKVRLFITLGSPHRGVDGIPFLRNNNSGIEWIDDRIEVIAYEKYVQATLSVAEMWNDPLRGRRYLSDNIFLPILNNEVDHPKKKTLNRIFFRSN